MTSTQQGFKGSLSVYAMLGLKLIKNHIETLPVWSLIFSKDLTKLLWVMYCFNENQKLTFTQVNVSPNKFFNPSTLKLLVVTFHLATALQFELHFQLLF
jgi:hypothetical protein